MEWLGSKSYQISEPSGKANQQAPWPWLLGTKEGFYLPRVLVTTLNNWLGGAWLRSAIRSAVRPWGQTHTVSPPA